jgi:hypothetical protein
MSRAHREPRACRNTVLAFAIACALLPAIFANAAAQGPFGLGVIVGEPTGVAAKYWLSNRTAFAGAVAWSFADEGAFHIHGDYLWHYFDRVKVEKGRLPLYLGVGGRFKAVNDDALLGVRFPLGVCYLLENAPVDFFLEVVPLLDLAPETELRGNAAFGFRYFFK